MTIDSTNGWIKSNGVHGFRGSTDTNYVRFEEFDVNENRNVNEVGIQVQHLRPNEYVEIYVPSISEMGFLYEEYIPRRTHKFKTDFELVVSGKQHKLSFGGSLNDHSHDFSTSRHVLSLRTLLSQSSSENPNEDSNLGLNIMTLVICVSVTLCCCGIFIVTTFKKRGANGEIKEV